jgi:hypothetical protein
MVELPGSLERSTLGDVLGALHRDRVSGALRLHETLDGEERQHVIHWRDGLIHHVETTRTTRPSCRGGDPRRVQAHWTPDDASKRQRLACLEALFELDRAKISFRVMGRHPAQISQPLEPTDFLHGRRRQRDASPGARDATVNADTPRQRALLTLGLSGEAGPDAVRAAFRQMAWRWHPDRHPQVGELTRAALCRRFAQISTAYEQLMARSA